MHRSRRKQLCTPGDSEAFDFEASADRSPHLDYDHSEDDDEDLFDRGSEEEDEDEEEENEESEDDDDIFDHGNDEEENKDETESELDSSLIQTSEGGRTWEVTQNSRVDK